jgi:hypothetical protein
MSFDPKTLTENIPDDVREAHANDTRAEAESGTAEFIAECKTKGDDGKLTLLASASCTLAVSLHQHMCALICKGSNDYMKPLDDLLKASGNPDIAFAAAFLAVGKTIGESYMDDASKAAKSGDMVKAMTEMVKAKQFISASLELANVIQSDLKGIIEGRLNGDHTGTQYAANSGGRIWSGVYPDKPRGKDQPNT